VQVLAGCAHAAHLEAPDVLANAIRELARSGVARDDAG
jgi:pimeloyl-ACP methyl ester carboxylesterase